MDISGFEIQIILLVLSTKSSKISIDKGKAPYWIQKSRPFEKVL
ncbi:hypothetical protein OM999_02285 [Mycoplasmopsis cynos]|nr:hypothetical protein [Mycoplasmopsis cynos]WAM06031.1 hypothetical protein OM999_02285 [Mycoplasmopsis cynos]